MKSFEYCIPTKIIFGEGSVKQAGESVAQFGKKILMVTYDENIAKEIGVYDSVISSLHNEGLEVVEFFGVKSNPVISHAKKGIELAKNEKVEAILAVGGGSVIDEAKFIAAGVKYDGDAMDILNNPEKIEDALPIVTVLTLPATSSESNNVSVMTDEKSKRKIGFRSDYFFPKISILDPELTYNIPIEITAYSSADTISHILEGYTQHEEEFTPFNTGYFDAIIKTIMECTERLLIDPTDKLARATLMWPTTFAWNGFGVCGLGYIAGEMHIFQHSLGGFYNIAHGAGMSVVMPGWMTWALDNDIFMRNISQFSKNIFGIQAYDKKSTARIGIYAFREWLDKIGSPTSFAKANLPTNDLDALADDALLTAKSWLVESYSKQDIIDIYKLCL